MVRWWIAKATFLQGGARSVFAEVEVFASTQSAALFALRLARETSCRCRCQDPFQWRSENEMRPHLRIHELLASLVCVTHSRQSDFGAGRT